MLHLRPAKRWNDTSQSFKPCGKASAAGTAAKGLHVPLAVHVRAPHTTDCAACPHAHHVGDSQSLGATATTPAARRRALEVLMRKLLQLPGAPAVVYLHWWSPTTNQGSRSFWNHTVEPESGTLAAYYSLPTLTLRNVWYPRWAANERGFLSRDVMCSINHPNYLGHQCARPGAAPYRLGLGFQPSCRVSVSQRLLACARFRMAWEGGVGKPRVPVMSMERSEQSAAAQLRRCAAPNERVAGRAQVLRGPHHRAAAGPPGGSRAGARARGRAGRPGRAARADAAGQPRGQRRPGVPARRVAARGRGARQRLGAPFARPRRRSAAL